jgi:hypothetical protein
VKVAAFVALGVAAGMPVLTVIGVSWLHGTDLERVLARESVTQVAQDVAKREFSGNVTLALLSDRASDNVTGQFGERIRADPGDAYRHVELRVENHGRLDVAVHTYHFTAYDASGLKAPAQVGISEGFEANQVPAGGSAVGTVVFELPAGARLARIVWQGELWNATLDAGAATGGT